MKRNLILVYIGLLIAMGFWGISYIWIKIVYRAYNPITMVTFRLLIATPIMFAVGKHLKKIQPIKKGHFHLFFWLAFVQPFLYFICESFGLQTVSPTVASVIITTIPLFTPIGAHYLFKEKMNRFFILGLIIAFIGVLLVIIREDFTLSGSPMGFGLLFMAVAVGVVYTMILKRISRDYSPYTMVTYQNLLGLGGFIPLFLIVDLKHVLTVIPTSDVLIALLLLALLPTTLAYILYAYAVREIGAANASMFSNILPVFTAVFAWLFLNEVITLRVLSGILLVISGLLISQVKKRIVNI